MQYASRFMKYQFNIWWGIELPKTRNVYTRTTRALSKLSKPNPPVFRKCPDPHYSPKPKVPHREKTL